VYGYERDEVGGVERRVGGRRRRLCMSSTVARGLEPSTLLLCIVLSRLETTISTIIPILITLYIYILLGIGPTVAHRESPITAHGADELKTSSVQFLSSSLLLPFLMGLSSSYVLNLEIIFNL
jgi:hypothetical protein